MGPVVRVCTALYREALYKQNKNFGRVRAMPWHLPYSWGKSMEKPQSG